MWIGGGGIKAKWTYKDLDVEYRLNPIGQILDSAGIAENGRVQAFHTQNVLRRIMKYMPFVSGTLRKLTITQTDINKPYIITQAPQAKFLYHGKLMLGDITNSPWARKGETKHVVNRDLEYNQEKNAKAGAYWDRALAAHEMPELTRELQRYINRISAGRLK